MRTSAAVKSAYWNLVSAKANVDARRTALQLAEELARVNRAKVDVGQSPPLDLVSAQAEVASNQEQLIIAETAVKQAEDRLRLLIFDTTDRDVWIGRPRSGRLTTRRHRGRSTSTARSPVRCAIAPISPGHASPCRLPTPSQPSRATSGCPTCA